MKFERMMTEPAETTIKYRIFKRTKSGIMRLPRQSRSLISQIPITTVDTPASMPSTEETIPSHDRTAVEPIKLLLNPYFVSRILSTESCGALLAYEASFCCILSFLPRLFTMFTLQWQCCQEDVGTIDETCILF